MATKQASERDAGELNLRQHRDRAEVEELLMCYTMSIDLRDRELFRSCFADRMLARFDPPLAEVPEGPMTPEEWATFAGAHLNSPEATQHYYSISSVRLEGDEAEALMYYRAGRGDHVDAPPFLNNTYATYRCRRTPSGWKIVEISTHSLPTSIELEPESATSRKSADGPMGEGRPPTHPGKGSKRPAPGSKRHRSAARRR